MLSAVVQRALIRGREAPARCPRPLRVLGYLILERAPPGETRGRNSGSIFRPVVTYTVRATAASSAAAAERPSGLSEHIVVLI